MQAEEIKGFSKLSKVDKIHWTAQNYFPDSKKVLSLLKGYWHKDATVQKLHDEFSENTITNFYLPFGLAPNFLIDGKMLAIPMCVEESSVVAAASKAAKFWLNKGGFKTTILGTEKLGHVHFVFAGDKKTLYELFESDLKTQFLSATDAITHNMRKRGGGITKIELIDKSDELENYFQIQATFETVDSMGANFINSCLEEFAKTLELGIRNAKQFSESEKQSCQVIMSILSNLTPNCMVRAEVSCPIVEMAEGEMSGQEVAEKFHRAVQIAEIEPYRATTHNKGIMNGIDSVVIATGNDFRAVEACAHAYASQSGKYKSLTHCEITDGVFRFWIDLPIALGTVGGLTSLHPIVKFSLELLGKPSAKELMGIVAVAGLAQNFAALRSLVTTGIQKGHMKMHLLNMLNQFGATEKEKSYFVIYFKDKTVTHHAVVEEFCRIRGVKSLEEL